MKRIVVLLAVLVFATVALCSDFSDGFCAGYKAGWCYQKLACLSPLCPLAPLPPLGQDSYMGGYNIGFLRGLSERR
jgi:hypothetical protein